MEQDQRDLVSAVIDYIGDAGTVGIAAVQQKGGEAARAERPAGDAMLV